MTLRPQDVKIRKVQVLIEKNPVKTSFEKWAIPGHFSRSVTRFVR